MPARTTRTRFALAALSVAFAGAVALASDERAAPVPSTDVIGFLQRYCTDCHAGDDAEGDRRLDELDRDFSENPAMAEQWQDVLHQLQLGEMPPADSTQPADDERQATIEWIERQLDLASERQRAASVEVVQRRLNRHEYLHAVRDLFGFREGEFDPTAAFPADEEVDGFRNNGAALKTSGYLIEQYFAAADMVLDRAYDEARVSGPADSQTWTCTPESCQQARSVIGIQVTKHAEPRIAFSQGLRSHESDYKSKLFLDPLTSGVPHSGWYDIEVSVSAKNRHHPYGDDLMPDYLRSIYPDPKVFFDPDQPLQIAVGQEHFRQLSETRRVAPRLLAQADVPDDREETIRFRIWIERGNTPYLAFANGPAEGTKFQFVTNKLDQYDPEVPKIDPEVWANLTQREERNQLYYDRYQGPELHVSHVSVSGPAQQAEPAEAYELLFSGIPPDATQVAGDALRADLQRVAARFFRRPVAAEDVEHEAVVIERRLSDGLNYAAAARPIFQALLCTPGFLFLIEPERDDPQLDAWELASRLSFFLWSSVPDADLLACAADGSLLQSETITEQVQRMLDDPRSERFAQHFTEQWLGLNRLGTMAPGMEEFPDYYLFRLEPAMKEETWRFFHDLLLRDEPVTSLVTADFTYANEGLCRLYGLAPVRGDRLQRVPVDASAGRYGLLGHASVLTVTSNGVETSPVIRGVWLLRNVFGTPPRPPPPDVPPLEPDIRGATTIRDQLARHRQIETCNTCHQRIDPLGFALENFDPIGRQRATYPTGAAIDTTAEYRGVELQGVADVRDYLVGHRRLLAHNVAGKMLTYALGKNLDLSDRRRLDRLVDAWEQEEFGLRDLVVLITESRSFREP